jgi:hypothetical protein
MNFTTTVESASDLEIKQQISNLSPKKFMSLQLQSEVAQESTSAQVEEVKEILETDEFFGRAMYDLNSRIYRR